MMPRQGGQRPVDLPSTFCGRHRHSQNALWAEFVAEGRPGHLGPETTEPLHGQDETCL